MKKIQMVDLQTQYQHIQEEVNQAIQEVIDNAAFINGPEVGLFAKELAGFLDIPHVIPCANGTDALQIALMALDLPKGSEVIVPAFNYVATAEVIALLDLVPRFVDVDPVFFTISLTELEAAIGPKTKVIMPVHLFGQCAPMEEIMAIASKHHLYVVEDNAQAIGAQYTFSSGHGQSAGGIGNIGTTSFFPSKNLGCMGDGGAIFTQNEATAARLKMIANHGQRKKYIYEMVGVNSRLDTMQAAILRVKLKNLSRYVQARQTAAQFYSESFENTPGISVPAIAPYSTHVFHQYTLTLDQNIDRNLLKAHLEKAGVPSMVYYPGPLHLQEAYQYLGHKVGDFPVAEMLCNRVISLPMHTELDAEQLNHIVSEVKKAVSVATRLEAAH